MTEFLKYLDVLCASKDRVGQSHCLNLLIPYIYEGCKIDLMNLSVRTNGVRW